MRPIADYLKGLIILINLTRTKRRYTVPIPGMKGDTTTNLIDRKITRENY